MQKQRLKGVVLSETILTSGALIGLNQLWYADYEHSALHAVNDNDEWLQMDKTGHFFRPTISRVLGQMLCDGVVVIKKVNCFWFEYKTWVRSHSSIKKIWLKPVEFREYLQKQSLTMKFAIDCMFLAHMPVGSIDLLARLL